MSRPNTTVRALRSGEELGLGELLGRGGEGSVFVVGDGSLVVKIFADHARRANAEVEAKLRAAVEVGLSMPDQLLARVTWPLDLAVDGDTVVGYLMRRLSLHENVEFHQVCNPTERHAALQQFSSWESRLHVSHELAGVVSMLHSRGVVVGDLNERNVLVSTIDKSVTIVDCDGMQFAEPTTGAIFRSHTFRPDFIAPEVMSSPTSVLPSDLTDRFSLAVLIFAAMSNGEHPFHGRWLGNQDKPSPAALAQAGIWSLGAGGQLRPRQGSTFASVAPVDLLRMFERAFEGGAHTPSVRPSADEWVELLRALRGRVKSCDRNSIHTYDASLGECPICAHESDHSDPTEDLTPEEPDVQVEPSAPGDWKEPDPVERGTGAEADGLSLGVAFSGGGIRAAAFSLGVLMAIAQCGRLPQLRSVSSVSGGSVTSGLLAAWDESLASWSDAKPAIARDFAALTRRGVGFWCSARGIVTMTAVAVAPVLVGPTAAWLSGSSLAARPMALVMLAVAGFALALGMRGVFQRQQYRRLLRARDNDTCREHIFCTTDLLSGRPLYFRLDGVFNEEWGWSRRPMPISKAVYASAAFPLVFPPLRVRTSKFRFTGGSYASQPRSLSLCDGGVHNNLATDWYDAGLIAASRDRMPHEAGLVVPDVVIAVNCSSRVRVTEQRAPALGVLPGLRSLYDLKRIIEILYGSTVSPRLESIRLEARSRARLLVDLHEDLDELVSRLGSDVPERVREDVARHATSAKRNLRDFCASVPTGLGRLSRHDGLRLLYSGYQHGFVVLASRGLVEPQVAMLSASQVDVEIVN